MNDLDLRLALHHDADLVGEPSPHLLDELARRRQHQRRQRVGVLAAAAAVVLIGAGIPVVSSLALRSHAAPATQPTLAPTAPVTEESTPTTPSATVAAPTSPSTTPPVSAPPAAADTGPTLTLAPTTETVRCSYTTAALSPSPFSVGFGGTVTVQLPASLTGGSGFHAELQSTLPLPTMSSTDPSSGLTMTGGANGTYRVTIPDTAALREIPGGFHAALVLGPLSTPVPGAHADGDCQVDFILSSAGARAGTFSPPGIVLAGFPEMSAAAGFPNISVPAGGTITLTLPSDSVLHTLGVDTVRDLQIELTQGYAGAVVAGDVDVSPDGRTAVLHVPATTPVGNLLLQANGARVSMNGIVTVTANG